MNGMCHRRPLCEVSSHGTSKRKWQETKKADRNGRRARQDKKSGSGNRKARKKKRNNGASEGDSEDSSSGDGQPVEIRNGQPLPGIRRKHDEKKGTAERETKTTESSQFDARVHAEIDDSVWTRLIKQPSLIEKKYHESYNHVVDNKDQPDGHQLRATPFEDEQSGELASVLEQYAAGRRFSAWTCALLAPVLNVRASNPMKGSVQSLFLGEGKPPVLLIVCGYGQEAKESALADAAELARALTSALLNYCHCEFIILPCAISKTLLSAETLRKEVEEKRKQTSKIYYRRQHLTRSEYLQLKKAVTTASRVSPVPRHLADNESKELCSSQQLVVLDSDWYNLVLFFVKRVMEGSCLFPFQRPTSDTVVTKVKTAAKEAGSRLGVETTCTEGQTGRLEIHIRET